MSTWKVPSARTWEGWEKWHAETRAAMPVRYFVHETVPLFFGRKLYQLKTAYWWVRHRTLNRYHIVPTGLEPGYYDKDTQLLHVCFWLLKDFVESEHGGIRELRRWTDELATGEDADMCERQILKQRECIALYEWWVNERPKRLDPNKPDSARASMDEEVRQTQEDDDMLVRLIRIRTGLWT